MPSEGDNFESFVDRLCGSGVPGDQLCSAILDVADAAYACKLWFWSNGLRPTAADVATMSRSVMEREAAIKASGGTRGDHPSRRKEIHRHGVQTSSAWMGTEPTARRL